MSRFAAALSAVLIAASLPACSDEQAEAPNTTPFQFVAGNWGVDVSLQFANCAGEIFFPREMWIVSTYLASVSAMPTPDTSVPPQPVTPPADPGATVSQDGSSTEQGLPPSFSAVMGETLHWTASLEQPSVNENGCLKRTTTLLDIQFTPEGQFTGTRSVFIEHAGGDDCATSCRMVFDLQGAMLHSGG
jgi:hypothetical protein